MSTWFFPFLLMLIVSAGYSVHAQATWQIEERCVGEPTASPEGWTFDGTLLMRGYYGLHGFRQSWDTPRVLVFDNSPIPYSGALSPDGRWYAVVEGTREEVQVITAWHTKAIHVYSTDSAEHYVVPWLSGFSAIHTLHGHGLYWLDNEHLLYSRETDEEVWFSINPFTGETSEWNNTPFTPSWDDFRFSPDRRKALYREFGGLSFNWHLHNGTEEISREFLNVIGWSPDSTAFAAYTLIPETYAADQLALFDIEGNITAVVFDMPENADINYRWGYQEQGWSPDQNYFLFGVQNRLYLADIHNQLVIDTCVPLGFSATAVWSPSGTQFALLGLRSPGRGIQIFDLNTWGRYVVGYHTGDVIGWRADD